MKYIKKYKYLFKFILFLIIITTFIALINMIFTLSDKTNNNLTLFTMSIYFLLNGFSLGKNADNKAYKVGFIKGLTFILIMYIIGGFTSSFAINLKKLFYYIILLACIILGSIIGINKKKNK